MSEIVIKNEKNDLVYSISGHYGTGYKLESLEGLEDGHFIFPKIEYENELGLYEIQICHNITGGRLELLKMSFRPHKNVSQGED